MNFITISLSSQKHRVPGSGTVLHAQTKFTFSKIFKISTLLKYSYKHLVMKDTCHNSLFYDGYLALDSFLVPCPSPRTPVLQSFLAPCRTNKPLQDTDKMNRERLLLPSSLLSGTALGCSQQVRTICPTQTIHAQTRTLYMVDTYVPKELYPSYMVVQNDQPTQARLFHGKASNTMC